MKKVFTKIAIVLTTGLLAFPLTACTFNFYVDSATRAIIKNYANQTSSVIKALVMGKEKNTDTSQTIQDILSQFSNKSISNPSSGDKFNNPEDFTNAWGFNKKINFQNFNLNDYFVKTGDGKLTQTVNSYRNMNDIFNKLNYISILKVADNRIVQGLVHQNKDVKNAISDFLNESKKTDPSQFPPNLATALTLLKNIVVGEDWKKPDDQAFQKNLVTPLTSLLDYLIKGQWTDSQVTTPKTVDELHNFMNNWKDPDGHPYSQWNDGSSWELDNEYYENWTPNDFNFYRGGTLINYVFYKIGKDYQITNPDPEKSGRGYEDRYLGDIIGDHLNILAGGLDKYLGPDLEQYLPHILTNTKYLFLLVQGIIPIIKQWALKMSDITQGVKNLTFGQKYPTDDPKNSYNLLDIFNNINTLLNNPDQLESLIKALMGWAPSGTVGSSFTYDLEVIGRPLGAWMNSWLLPDSTKQGLVNDIMNLINQYDVKGIFQNIINLYQQWIHQFDQKGEGINIDLAKLEDFLLNKTNGLVTVINRDIVPTLYKIINNPKPMTDEEYKAFYQSLGIQDPKNPKDLAPVNFKPNSLLDVLKTNLNDPNSPLAQIANILFGNSSKKEKGILAFITDSNNEWIKENYTKYFDVNNHSEGQVSNIAMTTTTTNETISDNLSYTFKYQINNHTYTFLIKAKSLDYKSNYTGTKSFYFTDIILKSYT